MATENTKIKIRNRQVELKLTFQYADHILDNFLHYNPPHDVSFLDIQRIVKKSTFKHLKRRIWEGEAKFKNKIYRSIIILDGKYAVLKTCFYITHIK